jgi:hypothetical protein
MGGQSVGRHRRAALRRDAARAYLRPDQGVPLARVRCELFVADIEPASIRAGDVTARLWTDAEDPGSYVPMRLCTGLGGEPDLCDANLVFESAPFPIQRTGAFSYTVEVSADSAGTPAWIAIGDIAPNRHGVIVVSPGWIADAPTVTLSLSAQGRCASAQRAVRVGPYPAPDGAPRAAAH